MHDTLSPPRRPAAVPVAKPDRLSDVASRHSNPHERVRVLLRGGNELELENPSVEGDELVAPGVSMPLADILRLEVQASRRGRTALWAFTGLAVIFMTGVVPDLICGPEEAPNGRC